LYKKGDSLLLKNWRPLGLSNSIAKLAVSFVDSCITDALYRLCSGANLLSDSQSGFRRSRNCQDSITFLLSIIEDAHACKKDLSLSVLDYNNNAFGSVSIIRLKHIVSMLRLPWDAIGVTSDIYDGASTRERGCACRPDSRVLFVGAVGRCKETH
jgi:hypothetical protein